MKSGILCLAVVGALVSACAHAVGLGAIEVKSKLNQPFVAEIPLTINNPDEANGLVVRLASPEAFERVGMDPNVLSANLQFSVGKNARGEPVVRVTTPQRMNDPYVTFLVEADWGKGKMVREYTALLDPPHTASVPKRGISAPTVASTPLPAPAQVAAPAPGGFQPVAAPATPAVQAPPPVAATPPAQPQPPPATPTAEVQASAPTPTPIAAAPQPEPLPPPPASTSSEPLPPPPVAEAPSPPPAAPTPEPQPPPPVAEAPPPPPAPMPEAPKSETARTAPDAITVSHGQTLSAIAEQVRPGDVSVNRMMIALERANPDAFIHDNINLLKSGAVLRIPASTDAQAITPAEANALVHEQVESWRQGAQPAPQLQPEETTENTVAKTASKTPEASSATAAADHSAAPKAKTAPASAHAADKASTATQTAATASAPKVSKPRGAHLEIVPPVGNAAANSQSGASEGGSGSELRAQLAQTKEELSARNAEVSDLKAKVGDLEKMQKDSAQLLKIRDSQLAAMQQRLADLEKNNAASPAVATSPAATPVSSSAPETPASASASAFAPSETTASASPASATPAPTTTAATPKPATAPAQKPTPASNKPSGPEVVQEPWYVQPFVWIGGGLLVLGGLLWLMLRRPREVEPPPRSRFDTDALAAGMTAARAEGDAPAAVPVAVARQQRASQSYRTAEPEVAPRPVEPTAAPAVTPVATAAVNPTDDDWAIPGSPTFLQTAAPAPAPEPVVSKATAAPNVTAVRPAVPSQEGHQTVATKLELARAYVDIGDADGARSMLEEVLIEGNAAQQQAAFELLDTLDG